ncbi:MAG: hypothetical protein M1837_005928 [Sclerophora amabilis]|nr:MAG: hypothetical protein M1837_005928 [Sclerophora amabilis]
MSSDADYGSFLDKANQDTGGAKAAASSKTGATRCVNTDVPASLQKVEKDYTSEVDEAFEPVSLQWEGKSLPTEGEFAKLLDHGDEVSALDHQSWDPRSRYGDVVASAAEAAGGGEVKVYRVGHGRTRVEYYVVALDAKQSRVVGLKAKAVES